MISITLRLSESLLCILRDSGSPKPETYEIQVVPGTIVKKILADQGINPLLVPMVSFKVNEEHKRIDTGTPMVFDGILTLYGPLAGG